MWIVLASLLATALACLAGWLQTRRQLTECRRDAQAHRQASQSLAVEREAAHDKWREGIERLRLAEKAARFGIWELDLDHGTMALSEGAAVLHGLPEAPQLRRIDEVRLLLHPDDREMVKRDFRSDGVHDSEFRLLNGDGSSRWCRAVGQLKTGPGPQRVIGALIDITEQKKLVDQLREVASRLDVAEKAGKFGVWEVDFVARTMTISRGMARLFDRPEGSAMCLSLEEWDRFTGPEHKATVMAAVDWARQNGQNFFYEYEITLPDGSVHWHRAQARDEFQGDRPLRSTGVTMDISGEMALVLSLEEARGKAEAATLAKSEFLANMSHELRTPMNGVIGMTSLLLATELTEEQRDFAVTLSNSGESLLAIVNDILDFSKLDANKLTIETVRFDLRQVLEDVAEVLAPSAHDKGLNLAVYYPSGMPVAFIGDGARIRQVVTNLVGNAIKFTHRGEVLISAERGADTGGNDAGNDGGNQVKISVTDTGIGIPADKMGILFEKFSQADASTSRKYGGTGLGLAISKKLVELMDGSIQATSAESGGSTFSFRLPLGEDPQSMIDAPATRATVILRGLRVLVVDDVAINRRILHERLAGWGMRAEVCASAEEALPVMRAARARGHAFDFVLADYELPGMNGPRFADLLKTDLGLKDSVCILLASTKVWKDLRGFSGVGPDKCLMKPVRHSKLEDTLCRLRAARVAGHDDSSQGTPPPLSSIHGNGAENDGVRLRALVVEDNPVNQKVAVLLLRRLGVDAEVAKDGEEGVQRIRSQPYDVIFMDCQMPVMNGYDAATAVRQLPPPQRDVWVVAMTADAMDGSRERCLKAGMDDFMTKPLKTEELVAALGRFREQAAARHRPLAGVEA